MGRTDPTEWPILVRACADSSVCFGLDFKMACMTHLSLLLQKWQILRLIAARWLAEMRMPRTPTLPY